MKVIEKYKQSKTGNIDLCEDTYLCNDFFAGVIDGATNVSGELFLSKNPGQLAARLIKGTIMELTGKENITEVLEAINKSYEMLYKELAIEEKIMLRPYIRPSAAMVLYSKYHNEVWMIGDCQFYHTDTLFQNIKHVDVVFEEVRSIIMKGELMVGRTKDELLDNDVGFDLIKPLIQKQYNFQNGSPDSDLSYGVINGFPIPLELIKIIKIPEDVTDISFGSDGYPRLFNTLSETEAELMRMLELDPLCIEENIGTKGKSKSNVSYDDRCYIKVQVK